MCLFSNYQTYSDIYLKSEIIHAKLFRKIIKGFKCKNKALTGYCQFLINTVIVFYNEPYKILGLRN